QAEDGIRDFHVTGVQTCALPICFRKCHPIGNIIAPSAIIARACLQWKHALAMIALGAMMLPIGWHFLKPYQKERVETFLRPEERSEERRVGKERESKWTSEDKHV